MHYLGDRSVLKDMFDILNILKQNLINSIGMNEDELHNLLKIDNKEYVSNLLTILENDEYINLSKLEEKLIITITFKGLEYTEFMENYLSEGGLLKINENKN